MSAAVRSSYDAKQEALELRERALARQVLRPAALCGALMRALRAMRFYSNRGLGHSLSLSSRSRSRLCCSHLAGVVGMFVRTLPRLAGVAGGGDPARACRGTRLAG